MDVIQLSLSQNFTGAGLFDKSYTPILRLTSIGSTLLIKIMASWHYSIISTCY
jgi:hypothetical protein